MFSFWHILYLIIIQPLTLLFELLLSLSYKCIPNPVFDLFALSLGFNFLVLPLYKRTDELQKQAKEKEAAIKPMVDHIKKHFSGDEKMMMLRTYYYHMNYNPINSLKSSISLLLQIPFFIAAYITLSSSLVLQGAPLGPIKDLLAPDAIIHVGTFTINLLPFVMTAINIISGMIYSKDTTKGSKIQLYATALVFLVLLYNSPSGLVLYWTFNNLFSLVKNMIMVHSSSKKKSDSKNRPVAKKSDNLIFFLYALCCSILVGLLIPTDSFAGSVGDFLSNNRTVVFSSFVWTSFFIAIGCFLFWGGIFYIVSRNHKIAAGVMASLTAVAFMNYFGFYKNYGNMNRYMYIKTYLNDDLKTCIINLLAIVLISILIGIIIKNRAVILVYVIVPVIAAILALSIVNLVTMSNISSKYDFIEDQRDYPEITLSRTGQNVVIVMMDRADGRILPNILYERPDLVDKFEGFTYYSNSLSFGTHTNMGSPALYGGYEYTPANSNLRTDMTMEEKQNEALRVLPVLFGENGYDVTVCDPSLAGYTWIPNLSIYDEYPYVDAYVLGETMNPYYDDMMDDWTAFMERNIFSYSLRLASPVAIRGALYDEGYFNDLNRRLSPISYFQNITDVSHARGYDSEFLNSYYALVGLPSITNITSNNEVGSFVMLANTATHCATMLDEETYSPSLDIDNSEYDLNNADRFTAGDPTIYIDLPEQMAYYQSQVASLEALGSWFDYLRAEGVYDNTRIIIVSDHGTNLYLFGGQYDNPNICNLNCLLMVKDFGDEGFTTCNDFIVNAETPYLATYDLINNPVNPFTGNPIATNMDNSDTFTYFMSDEQNPMTNNGNTYLPGSWYSYDASSGDIYDLNAWAYLGDY